MDHGLQVTPVHPKESSVEEIDTVASITDLPDISKTSLSVITPPKVTLGILKSALNDLNVAGIWLQVSDYSRESSNTFSPHTSTAGSRRRRRPSLCRIMQ